MAVTANVKSVGLKIVSNYGEQNGKIVKRSKTYCDVKSDATNESIYNTYKLIKNMQEPIGEGCERVTTSDITEIV